MIGNNVKMIINNLHDGLYFVDLQRRVTFWNEGAERITGYKSEEVIGAKCGENILMHLDEQGDNLCLRCCPLSQTIIDGESREEQMFLKHKEGHRVPVSVRTAPVRDPGGKIMGAVQIFSDDTSKIAVFQKIEELRKMVFLDSLTGVANKQFIEKDLQAKFDEMERFGWSFGILAMDLDDFKKINEEYGVEMGDKVLKMVAKTLSSTSRTFDNIGRWDEEEFIAIIAHVNQEKLASIAERYRVLIEKSNFIMDDNMLQVTVSIGATVAQPEDTVETLIKRAEELLHRSKAAGRNCVTADS